VSGVLDVAGATATQQLAAVTHDATTAVSLPAMPQAAAAQVPASAAQSVATAPQAVAAVADVARPSANAANERPLDGDGAPVATGGRDGSAGRPPPPPPAGLPTLTKHAPGLLAKATTPGERAAIVPAVRRTVSSRIERLGHTLEATAREVPTARELAGRAPRIARALLGTVDVADVAAGARDTLAALPVPDAASLAPASSTPDPSTLLAAGTAFAVQSGIAPFAAAAGLVAIGSVNAVSPGVSPLGLPPAQLLTLARDASGNPLRSGSPLRGAPQNRDIALAATSAAPPNATSLAKAPGATPAPGEAVPARSPFPGGFSPTSSAGAAGGLSAMTALALAALLLLAAPRAMRRLRRAGASWRLAPFALIPARPG
jgi:hypothetical protein